MSGTPAIQQANNCAQRGEELQETGRYVEASECHFRAAELFLLAMNDSKDQHSIKVDIIIKV